MVDDTEDEIRPSHFRYARRDERVASRERSPCAPHPHGAGAMIPLEDPGLSRPTCGPAFASSG